MMVFLLMGIAIIIWQREYLMDLYIENQVTRIGWIINGAILLLFVSGLVRLIALYFLYDREETVLDKFSETFLEGNYEQIKAIATSDTIIGRRFDTVVDF